MKLFGSFIRQTMHMSIIYRFDFWIGHVRTFTLMLGYYWLWHTLYSQTPGAFGLTQEAMVAYGLMSVVLLNTVGFGTGIHWYMAGQVRTGAIDTDLMKPVDFQLQMLARAVGVGIFQGVFAGLPAFVFGLLFLHLRVPPSALTLAQFVLSVAMGFVVMFSLNFLLGLLAMITLDISSINWTWNALINFFAGAIVPLWLLPGWLGNLAGVLPYRATFAVPLSIWAGQLSGRAAWEALAFQLAWMTALVVIGRLCWLKVWQRLVVQGG